MAAKQVSLKQSRDTLLMTTSQYWIIDAFDECKITGARMGQTFGSLLAKIDSILPLKIFISSRPTPDAAQLFDSLQPTVVLMNYDTTANDIRRYVENSRGLLPVKDDGMRKDLVEEIIEKSRGLLLVGATGHHATRRLLSFRGD